MYSPDIGELISFIGLRWEKFPPSNGTVTGSLGVAMAAAVGVLSSSYTRTHALAH